MSGAPQAKPIVFAIDQIGSPVGQGVTNSTWVTLQALCKQGTSVSCWVEVEYICARLAMLSGLPVAPGVLVDVPDSNLGFVSLRFGSLSTTPAPIIPDDLATEWPHLAALIYVFDQWIGNSDRHSANLAYQGKDNAPIIFDHSHAFHTNGNRAELNNLAEHERKPIGGHCLASTFHSAPDLQSAIKHFSEIPESMWLLPITELETISLISNDESKNIREYLKSRQIGLATMVKSQLSATVSDWSI